MAAANINNNANLGALLESVLEPMPHAEIIPLDSEEESSTAAAVPPPSRKRSTWITADCASLSPEVVQAKRQRQQAHRERTRAEFQARILRATEEEPLCQDNGWEFRNVMSKECSICYETHNRLDTVYVCTNNHGFGLYCIDKWVETRNTCPVCREVIVKE